MTKASKASGATTTTRFTQRTARISVRPCNYINLGSSSESSPTRTTTSSPPYASLNLATTPPPAPSQPPRELLPLSTNIEPLELIFHTSLTSPHLFMEALEDLPPRTSHPPPLLTFDTIECVALQPLRPSFV
nr:hypothetical protein [Tanacetum cinerariifolium]